MRKKLMVNWKNCGKGLRGFLVVFCVFVSGCSTPPAPDAGFASSSSREMEENKSLPFQRVWVSEDAQKIVKRYDKLYLAPINTNFVMKEDWWNELNVQGRKKV